MSKRIGILSGTFDPVHKGHIALALHAIEQVGLGAVYFMPEASPRRKEGMTHYAHRMALLQIAIRPYKKLHILEVPDKQFSVTKTMPRLKMMFKQDHLFLIIGSDAVVYLADAKQWPNAELLLRDFGIIVGLRNEDTGEDVKKQLEPLVSELHIIATDKKHASSSKIRIAIASNDQHEDSIGSTKHYISKNWLYTASPNNTSYHSDAGSAKRS